MLNFRLLITYSIVCLTNKPYINCCIGFSLKWIVFFMTNSVYFGKVFRFSFFLGQCGGSDFLGQCGDSDYFWDSVEVRISRESVEIQIIFGTVWKFRLLFGQCRSSLNIRMVQDNADSPRKLLKW